MNNKCELCGKDFPYNMICPTCDKSVCWGCFNDHEGYCIECIENAKEFINE